MGGPNPERELTRALTAYNAAVHRLWKASARLRDDGLPGVADRLVFTPWTADQIDSVGDVATAWHEVWLARRAYEACAQDVAAPR